MKVSLSRIFFLINILLSCVIPLHSLSAGEPESFEAEIKTTGHFYAVSWAHRKNSLAFLINDFRGKDLLFLVEQDSSGKWNMTEYPVLLDRFDPLSDLILPDAMKTERLDVGWLLDWESDDNAILLVLEDPRNCYRNHLVRFSPESGIFTAVREIPYGTPSSILTDRDSPFFVTCLSECEIPFAMTMINGPDTTRLIDEYLRPWLPEFTSSEFEWYCYINPLPLRLSGNRLYFITDLPLAGEKGFRELCLKSGVTDEELLDLYKLYDPAVFNKTGLTNDHPWVYSIDLDTGELQQEAAPYSDLVFCSVDGGYRAVIEDVEGEALVRVRITDQ